MKISILKKMSIFFGAFVWITISGLHASDDYDYEMDYDENEVEWVSNEFFESMSGEFEFDEGYFEEESQFEGILVSALVYEESRKQKKASERTQENPAHERKSERRSNSKSKKSEKIKHRNEQEGVNQLSTKGLVGFYFHVLRDIILNASGIGVNSRLAVIDQTLKRLKLTQNYLDKKTMKKFSNGLQALAKNVAKMKQKASATNDGASLKKLRYKTLRQAKKLKKVVDFIEEQ